MNFHPYCNLGIGHLGKYHGLPIVEMHAAMRNDYGNIIRIPGLLGRSDTLLTYKPAIFEKVFRTEGPFPERRGLETFIYYRKKVRPEIFGNTGGLLSEHGEKWLDVRSKVNPVMLQPRVVKMYVGKVDQIVDEFLIKMRMMRDPVTMEMTNRFGHQLNCWALETVGELALDERLGLLNDTPNHHGSTIINVTHEINFLRCAFQIFSLHSFFTKFYFLLIAQNVKDFFVLAYELDVALSVWKFYKTPKFHKLMEVFDQMTETIMFYVDKAVARLDARDQFNNEAGDRSVLEKLLMIDRRIAIVMAFDMLFAGVDTVN